MIAVDGRKCWTLFDSGARNTYVIPSVAEVLKTSATPRTIRTALGGGVKETNTEAVLHAEIEGHSNFDLCAGDRGDRQRRRRQSDRDLVRRPG
jgi:hypothetical protein